MPMRERAREIARRRRRARKLRDLKRRMVESQDPKARKKIMEKIRLLVPWGPLPDL
jgi:hypothetical protein